MRALRIEFHPEQVRISPEEILADLSYPVRKDRRENGGRERARRRRGRA